MKIKSLNDIDPVRQYLNRINAKPRSLRQAVVEEERGQYWTDLAVITFDRNGNVTSTDVRFNPTDDERDRIKTAVASVEFPKSITANSLSALPDKVKNAESGKDLFVYRNTSNDIVMVQHRVEIEKDGEQKKHYVPWTFYDDGEWRQSEPDGKLPLYNLELLNGATTVFLHEGAKGANRMTRMLKVKTFEDEVRLSRQPWAVELSQGVHLGWQGGAQNPHRTDWSSLKRSGVDRVIIIPDNDHDGIGAVPAISKELGVSCFHIQFNMKWPKGFDLGDEWPKDMFKEINGEEFYVGPSFHECLNPATWATDLIPQPGRKPFLQLRDTFKKEWQWISGPDLFVNTEFPSLRLTEKVFNQMVAPFSDTSSTATLVYRSFTGQQRRIAYRPDYPNKRFISDGKASAINVYEPPVIGTGKLRKRKPGDIDPWVEYVTYMIPEVVERHEFLRWSATLIARPDVKMNYALLLISEEQGIGKTIFATKFLAPLVGMHNTGIPSESDIVDSVFNGWLAHKRLIICNEIYSGHSWKAYNKLKSAITDREVTVNEKYEKGYQLDNWAHFVACSNSKKALKMEQSDRRWFYPELTEVPWPKSKFDELLAWQASGGLEIVKSWAEDFRAWTLEHYKDHPEKEKFNPEYVTEADRAPMTRRKEEMIFESRSDAQREIADLLTACKEEKITFALKELRAWVKGRIDGPIYDSDHEIKKMAKDYGFRTFARRVAISGQTQSILVAPALWKDYFSKDWEIEKSDIAYVREHLKGPGEVAGRHGNNSYM